MNTKPNQTDAAIDKTLAALNTATPPDGMETRIVARLAAQPAPAASPRAPFSPAWWRGAATGAAFALLAVAAVLLLQHKTPPPNRLAVATPTLNITPVNTVASATPCAHPAILRTHAPVSLPSPALLLAEAGTESAAPSHPAPVLPLTAQERALARLARTADPQQLAALTSEPEIKLEAETAAASTKFSASPPAPPLPEDQPAANPPANPEPAPAAAPEPSPASNPEPAPEAAPEPGPTPNPEPTVSTAPQTSPAANN
jgi:hypothetical protein